MATKIKDQATAEKAALNLNKGIEVSSNGEPTTPQEKGTSERLFPEFTTPDGGIINRPIDGFKDTSKSLPVSATLTLESQVQNPPTAAPTAPVYITENDLKGKMAKLKVDGIEQDVPAEQLIKTNQLERHLNSQLQGIAEERKRLEAEKAAFLTRMQTSEPQKPTKQEQQVKKSAIEEAMEARIAQMQQTIDQLGQAVAPTLRETGLKRIDAEVRKNLGAEDFMTYAPKIQEFVDNEMTRPEVASNPELQKQLLNSGFWYNKYQEMKLREMIQKSTSPTPQNTNAPMLVTQSGAPVVMNNQGNPVSIPNIEGSGGVPSRSSPDSDWQGTYNTLLSRAKESNRTEDWMAVYRHKTQSR